MSEKTIRAKVVCTGVKQESWGAETVGFCGVYSNDPNSENKSFATSTPCLNTNMTIDNPAAKGSFKDGEEYYLDFTHAPKVSTPNASPNKLGDVPPSERWIIGIRGRGIHHNGRQYDADVMARKFVEFLKQSGHDVECATFELTGPFEDINAPVEPAPEVATDAQA